MPLYIGIPGPVGNRKLLAISSKIGLGESARFLRKHRSWLLRMFLPGGYRPDRLVEGLTSMIEDPWSRVWGFHIYTFNELGNTEAWRLGLLERIEAT